MDKENTKAKETEETKEVKTVRPSMTYGDAIYEALYMGSKLEKE